MTVPVDAKGKIIPGKEEDLPALIKTRTAEMKQAAKDLEFEKAASLRDEIKELNKILLEMG
jgi:Helicase subunit of the DNA excision repair complex